jgi:hypothetical protein
MPVLLPASRLMGTKRKRTVRGDPALPESTYHAARFRAVSDSESRNALYRGIPWRDVNSLGMRRGDDWAVPR